MRTSTTPASVSLFLTSSLLGCGGDVSNSRSATAMGTGGSGGNAGQTSTIASCIDVSLSDANVNVYTGSALLIVERTGAVDPNYFWSPVVTIAVPGGTSQACTASGVISSSSRFASVECPALSASACGSNVNVQVTLGANGYSYATGNTSPSCQSPEMTLTYTVPVKCPTCPSSWTSGPCDVAPSTNCSYQGIGYNSGGVGGYPSVTLPCLCNFNSATGVRSWSCAIS
jgi:hypothetical protein